MRMESSTALALCLSAAAVLVALALLVGRRMMPGSLRGPGWRLRRVVPGRWDYEEKLSGKWVGIPFEELQDFRDPPYVVIAPSEAVWSTFPAWAQERRTEIIVRVRTALSRRNYVVEGPDGAPCAEGGPTAGKA
jgi:hypothetical protein